MDAIESLSKRIGQAVREILELKKQRQQLLTELDIHRRQARGHQSVLRENEKLRREQDLLRSRLLRLQKKIDKHLLVETTLAAGASGVGGRNEEYPQ